MAETSTFDFNLLPAPTRRALCEASRYVPRSIACHQCCTLMGGGVCGAWAGGGLLIVMLIGGGAGGAAGVGCWHVTGG